MRDADKAWGATLRAAENQLRLLTEAVHRPEVHAEGITRNALDLLLDALAAALPALQTLPELTAELAAFTQSFDVYRKTVIDVQLLIPELAAGWSCPACSGKAARAACVQGVRRGPLRVALRCRTCDTTAPITDAGGQAFKARLGHLLAPTWNPRMHGLEWDGT